MFIMSTWKAVARYMGPGGEERFHGPAAASRREVGGGGLRGLYRKTS